MTMDALASYVCRTHELNGPHKKLLLALNLLVEAQTDLNNEGSRLLSEAAARIRLAMDRNLTARPNAKVPCT